ncbi:MAG: 30S ribosome-binding factor RbfA [Phycisphaeraceae bacterium]|nr:MAG: 30S ribosome-binding factor RbfA [Phycisphaeraceae bacterium]
MSRRSEQMASLLHSALSEVFARGLNDPRVGGLITVTGVRVTEDLSRAVVRVSVLPESKQKLAMHGIEAASAWIRKRVGPMVDSRKLPQFVFELDEGLKSQAKVIEALERVRSEPGAPGWGRAAPGDAGGGHGVGGEAAGEGS